MNEAALLTTLPDSDRRHLLRAATRLLGPADAEDAVQDAYVRALEADRDTTAALNSTQAWLLTVVRNLAIDRLRRRNWMAQWLDEEALADVTAQAAPSAEADAALAQEVAHALRQLAAHLAPEDGAALLLHSVFDVGHADIARASGRSEAASRQQLRRAMLRLRQAQGSTLGRDGEREPTEEAVLRLYVQALQLRDPQTLWALLRHPPISAMARVLPVAGGGSSAPHAIASGGVVQIGGQLGLVLTLDGVTLCVVPLGATASASASAEGLAVDSLCI